MIDRNKTLLLVDSKGTVQRAYEVKELPTFKVIHEALRKYVEDLSDPAFYTASVLVPSGTDISIEGDDNYIAYVATQATKKDYDLFGTMMDYKVVAILDDEDYAERVRDVYNKALAKLVTLVGIGSLTSFAAWVWNDPSFDQQMKQVSEVSGISERLVQRRVDRAREQNLAKRMKQKRQQ